MFRCPEAFAAAIERNFVPFDENDFVDWIVDAKASDCIAYYRGHVGRDRHPSFAILNDTDCRKLSAVASRVMVAADQGLVFPFQKRLGPHDYVYIAVRALGRLAIPFQQMPAHALAA
jgi:hypothetical protein